MINFNEMIVRGQDLRTARKSYVLFFAILGCFVLQNASLLAQTYSWFSASEYHFSLHAPDEWVDAGDTVWVDVHIGTGLDQAIRVCVVDLYLNLTEDADMPASICIDPTDSWLFGSAGTSSSHTQNYSLDRLEFKVVRNDSTGQTGGGAILKIPVVSLSDNVLAEDLINGGGGLVLIENIDMLKTESNWVDIHRIRMGSPQTTAAHSHLTEKQALTKGLFFIIERNDQGQTRTRKVNRR